MCLVSDILKRDKSVINEWTYSNINAFGLSKKYIYINAFKTVLTQFSIIL